MLAPTVLRLHGRLPVARDHGPFELGLAKLPAYEVMIDGKPVEVIHTASAAIVRPLLLKPATIEVRSRLHIRSAVIRPLRLGTGCQGGIWQISR